MKGESCRGPSTLILSWDIFRGMYKSFLIIIPILSKNVIVEFSEVDEFLHEVVQFLDPPIILERRYQMHNMYHLQCLASRNP